MLRLPPRRATCRSHDAALDGGSSGNQIRLPDHCGGRLADELEVAGIILRHEAVRDDPRPEMSGHFHPKLRLQLQGLRVSRRCFVVSQTKLILPAFGSLTGGLGATHSAFLDNVGSDAAARIRMADAARALGRPHAAREVASDLLDLSGIGRHKGNGEVTRGRNEVANV